MSRCTLAFWSSLSAMMPASCSGAWARQGQVHECGTAWLAVTARQPALLCSACWHVRAIPASYHKEDAEAGKAHVGVDDLGVLRHRWREGGTMLTLTASSS